MKRQGVLKVLLCGLVAGLVSCTAVGQLPKAQGLRRQRTLARESFHEASATRIQMAYNYCTLSYTMALWSEEDWEAEIDRLAAAGFTHVLVNAGMEAVWYDFLTKQLGTVAGFENYTDEEARAHIPHPTWRAWWLMGNLEGEGEMLSPDGLALSLDEINRQKRIGRTIIRKLREHKMVPVLNAYMGLMPTDFDTKYPDLAYLPQTSNWCGFVRPDQLLPTDPKFAALAWAYHTALFETYDLGQLGDVNADPIAFSGDLFHEGGAKPAEDAVTTASAEAVQREMQVAQPGALWFVQHWNENPTHALKAGCDERYTVIQRLDKDMRGWLKTEVGEREYIGKNGENIPWIWTEVTNFGDNPNFYGSLRRMATTKQLLNRIFEENQPNPTLCIGWGMLDEGISYQPLYFAKMLEILGKPLSDSKTTPILALARGRQSAFAWGLLMQSVYQPTQWQEGCSEGILCAEPYFGLSRGHTSSWGWGGPYYDKRLVRMAGEYLYIALEKDHTLINDPAWKEFYIDVLRQIASDAFTAKEVCRKPELFVAMDELLLRSEKYTLDFYWKKALDLSRPVNPDGTLGEPNEDNALRHYRNYLCLMTIWRQDDTTNFTGLHDYSHRHLGGMMVPYYGRRWADYWEGKTSETIRATDAQWWKRAPIPPKAIPATAEDLLRIGKAILSFDIALD